jgi:peptidoglycan/LPS O-acetylase OafA/YrhL
LFGIAEDYGPLWSLAVEEHYYLVWPLVVRYLSRRQVGVVAALISAVTAVIRVLAFHGGQVSGLGSFTWFVADGLALGSVLAVLVRGALSRSQLWALSGRTIVLGYKGGSLGWTFRDHDPRSPAWRGLSIHCNSRNIHRHIAPFPVD